MQLERLFNPRSVGFLGATDDTGKFGGKCLAALLKFGYRGRLLPVNPRHATLFDRPCYPSVAELPEVPDHMGIALPAARALEALEECGRLGVPYATVYSAGFLEMGHDEGRRLQERLRSICRRTGIRVVGPNCAGMVNFVDRFALTSSATARGSYVPAGEVAIAAQSGGAGMVNTMWRALQAGLRVSCEVSSGNDADLDTIDYIDFMLDSEATRVVLVVAERIPDGARLKAVADKAMLLDKPILMVKLGRSESGKRAAASHTGAISSPDDIVDAALSQWGIVRVDDTNDLIEYAKLFRRRARPAGRRVCATSVSGGNLVLASDLGELAGVAWPEFSRATSERLAHLMPEYGTLRNPLDLTTAVIGTEDALVQAGRAMLQDEQIETFVPVLTMANRAEVEAVAEFALTGPKSTVVLWTGGCIDDPLFLPRTLVERGVPAFDDTAQCFRAIAACARLADRRDALAADGGNAGSPRVAGPPPPGGARFTERTAKQWLGAWGLPVTEEVLAADADAAARIAVQLGGRVALKIESADIAHKTEAGAIRLDVQGDAAVRAAFDEVMRAARDYAPGAALDGVLVQAMVAPGFEMILGMAHDAVFGPVITVGAGGVYVEVLQDVAHRVVPVSPSMAREMLKELRVWPILAGARGRAACDVEAVVDAIVALSALAEVHGEAIAEIDINPLVVHAEGSGARVVDALIVRREPTSTGKP